jgi:putative phage-type endonuclease
MIIERDIIQGSPEWFAARCGNPGASGFSNIITSTGKRSTSREKYLYKMAGEKLSDEKEESFSSSAMARGIELEPKARQSFQFETGLQVEEVGLVYPDELRQWHVSPDSLVIGQKKGLEIKCPLMSTHVGYLAKNKLPTEYVCQVQASLLCTGYESWYFFSFYPGIKPLLIEVPRDEKLISLMDEAIREFIFDLGELVKKLL